MLQKLEKPIKLELLQMAEKLGVNVLTKSAEG